MQRVQGMEARLKKDSHLQPSSDYLSRQPKRVSKEDIGMLQSKDESKLGSLEGRFVEFAEAVLKQAAIWTSSENVPLNIYQQIVFSDNSSWTRKLIQQINYSPLLNNHKDTILSMEEAQECGRLHWQAGIPMRETHPSSKDKTAVESPTPEQVRQVINVLLYPIVTILQQHNTFSPTRDQIITCYQRFFEAWIATTIHENETFPLLNFRIEQFQSPVKISNHYHIIPFSLTEKTAFWGIVDAFQAWDRIPFHSFLQTEFKLEGSRSYPRLRSDSSQQEQEDISRSHLAMLEEIRDIVTALRLLQAGDVGITTYVAQNSDVPPYGGHSSMGFPAVILSDFRLRMRGATYILDEARIPAAYQLIKDLQQLNGRPHSGGLEVALHLFNQSYSRDFFEDRLIDLAVALESCLLAAIDSKTELSYRFTLQGAALLADAKKPQDTKTLLSALYNARSSIVHKGQNLSAQKRKSLAGLEPKEFLQSCEDIVREILREYVRLLVNAGAESSVSAINKELEQRIFSGLTIPLDPLHESSSSEDRTLS